MNNTKKLIAVSCATLTAMFFISLAVGRYPISIESILSKDEMTLNVLYNLRLPRSLMAVIAGMGLSMAGYAYQTIFKNPLASPDIIGASSGACVGAAVAIVFFGGYTLVTAVFSFIGALTAVFAAFTLAKLSKNNKLAIFVLAGISISAVSQSALMFIKLTSDPEKQLAAIEYWIMGSLSSITLSKIIWISVICIVGMLILFTLQRQLLMLSLDVDEAKMLGVSVIQLRTFILTIATVIVGAIVSVAGLISFVGLIAPHLARLIIKTNNRYTMILSAILGGILLLLADCGTRVLGSGEMPISVFTSLVGAPMLIALVLNGEKVS